MRGLRSDLWVMKNKRINMSVTLTRPYAQEPLVFTLAECQALLDDLVDRHQAYVEQASVVYWRIPPALGLFKLYVGNFPNRRLVERFELSFDPNLFEGMLFRGDACVGDLAEALTCIGRTFPTPLVLADVYMTV